MTCDGFVADVPARSRIISHPQYPSHLEDDSVLTRCKSCGQFHEIRLPAPTPFTATSTAMAVA